jgi:hypothetical protein
MEKPSSRPLRFRSRASLVALLAGVGYSHAAEITLISVGFDGAPADNESFDPAVSAVASQLTELATEVERLTQR